MSNATFRNEIEKRAFDIYETRGREPGNDLDDWLQAEKEILSNNKSQTGKSRFSSQSKKMVK